MPRPQNPGNTETGQVKIWISLEWNFFVDNNLLLILVIKNLLP